MHTERLPDKKPEQEHYKAPVIVHRGKLKQFAGSPLGDDRNTDPDILGLSG